MRKRIRWLVLLALVAACAKVAPPVAPGPTAAGNSASSVGKSSNHGKVADVFLTSGVFGDDQPIPKKCTCEGGDVSPPMSWPDVANAQSFTLICEDRDAPGGAFTHWVVFNIPPDLGDLPEGLPPGEHVKLKSAGAEESSAIQGANDFKKTGYGGPCPPEGTHHYVFTLDALDTKLSLKPGATKEQVREAMRGHVLAEGRLVGLYEKAGK